MSGRARRGRRAGERRAAPARARAGGRRAPAAPSSRRGYNPHSPPQDSEYHYGSDFGDESDDDSEADSLSRLSSSPSPSPAESEAVRSESEVSLLGDTTQPAEWRRPSPEPLWLQHAEPPPLSLPNSSEDLLLAASLSIRAMAVYELLRRFRHLVRLTPFRVEDMCAALSCDEQSNLLAEIHMALLKALLREEDSQQTHFGPIDHKDSVNISLFMLDVMTWPEVLRIYVESDRGFDRDVLQILNSCEYPFTGPEERIKILEFLGNQFLVTNPVREDLTSEVSIHYDDHCRVCHRLGDLLCCETCPAVFHLECVDPPLVDVPSEDWQCSLCKVHRLQGVTDCISDTEKQGLLCRHEHLGFDRHGRKYWFICRRIFVEEENGAVWYYSSRPQFDELLLVLDSQDMECALYRELMEFKSEIIRQMEITDKITNQLKGSRKSYLEVENSFLTRVQKERVDKKIFDNNGISKDVDAMDDLVSENSNQANNVDDETNSLLNDNSSAFDHDDSSNQNKSILSMSITEDGKKKSDDKSDKQLDVLESQRLTRLKINQISAGTLLFKLGNDNHFRNYVNQYTTNTMALNKPQRNEERDKKRHLAHKFSLTCTQEFKWTGLLNVTRSLLINTLRQTLLQLETNVASVFMHPNWSLLRKPWLQAVHASNVPRDFARAMVVLQACIKSVVFVPVWHEQLGHVRLQRITAGEREERKKLDKREKKEKEEEEERNKVSFFVKYPITLKHQIWKQKGEEYRIHGQWGWLWHSATRKFRNPPIARHSLQLGPLKYIVQVQIHNVNKTIFIEPKTYDYLVKKDQDLEISKNVSQDIKALKPIVQPSDFIEIDIEKALSSNSRIFYPKIAKKSRLDDMLARRVQLKVIEERKFDQNVFLQKKKEDIKDEEEQNVDVENDDNENDTSVISTNPKDSATPSITSKDVANMTKEIQTLRQKYGEIVQQAKGYRCYAYGCNMNNATLSHGLIFSVNCYSPLCIRKANLRKDLLLLLNKVRNSTNNIVGLGASKSSANTSQHEDGGKGETDIKEYANDIIKDLITAVASAQKLEDKHYVDIVKLSAKVKMEMDMSNESDVKPFVCNSGSPVKSEHILEESVIPAIGNEMELEQCVSSENDVGELNVVDVDKVVDNSESEKKIKKERKIRDLTYVKSEDNDSFDGERPPIPKIRISTRGRTSKSTISNVTKKSMKPLYRALVNRRFCSNKHSVKRERVDRVVKNELAPDGSKRVYSAESSAGKIYLKRIVSALDKKKKRIPVRYPLCSTFHTKSKAKSIMVLPAHELRKLSRHGGRLQVNGYNHNSKPNPCVWPYPCSRPIFKTCWLYRTINLSSLAAVCLQIRILWACVRWDDMATKPSNNDGKHQITTETEIISLEMLKHRHIGQFLDKTQYLRRKVVIPLEVPKTVREVTSIRSGLRKRKRAESPQSMEPQVTEEWVDEDKLELWEIKQYGEKVERAVPVTRTTTGKLPPSRSSLDSKENSSLGNAPKSTPQEIKEKMELQLRMQRTAHQQKRALELAQGIVNTNGNKTLIGTRRVFMTKGADGTTRVISQPGILPKTTMQSSQSPGQQSIIKSQLNQPPKDGPQKVQIIRGHDGKLTVRGLIAGQQLLQMPDGKLHVVASSQTGNLPNGGQIIATGGPPPTPKIAVTPQPKPHTKILPTTSTANKPISPVTTTTSTLASNKVVIRQQTPSKPIAQTPDKQTTQTPQRIISQGTQQIVVQGNQQILVQSPQQVVVQAQNRLSQPTLVPVSQATILQQNRPVQAVIQGNQIVQSGQTIQSANVIQGQVVRPMQAQQQIITTNAGPQVVNRMISPGQHIVVNNPALAQQLAAGKLQLASINGQQVLIRPIGNNQALVVAHVAASQNTTNIDATPQNQIPNSPTIVQQNQVVPSPTVGVAPQIVTTIQGANQNPVESQVTQMSIVKPAIPSSPAPVVTQPVVPLTEDQLMEQRLLAGQPPGTVIKTVTAQVVHLDGGPRIVLQGLQGNSLTQQQLQLVQHQVKQQLLKAQEVTGKQGMLGPTKLFLAVQPCPPAGNATVATPATINAVRPQHNQISQDQNKTISALLQSNKSKNVPTTVLINGQDPLEPPAHIVLKPSAAKSESDSQVSSTSNKFVLTPDYIQQTIKNALKQENLNPEIEEKLLQLQKYQERQMKPDSGSSSESIVSSSNIRMLTGSPPMQMQSSSSSSSRRRPASSNRNTDDDDWVESTPRKRNRTIVHHESRIDTMDDSRFTPIASRARPTQPVVQVQEVPPLVQSSPSPSPYSNMPHSPVDERRRTTQQSKLPILLFRHKELLKKDIIKKRGLLEKELGIEIQRELSAELALRTKAERNKQEEVRSNNVISNSSSNPRRRPMPQCSSSSQQSSSHPMPTMSSSSRSKQRKKEKLLCICRKPYDETKFYVGCEHCNNWFHGDCVGITEEMSKTINEFVCNECKHARDTQELYCLCKQPYDNSQFYICCDRCQDWFHGRCVGILQSEADNIDEYICPQCQKNNSVNFANMKELSHKDFENLKKLIKQIQLHRSAWPFMEPVDPREAPMYYKVIKEPMDLQIIEKKINEHSYNMLSELIGDMTKIFDNCRYFNPKESQFYRCAESLEAFFVQRIKFFREKLFESNQ